MTSIDAVFTERSSGPYNLAIKVQIVAVKSPEPYKKDGEDRSLMHFAMSDGTAIIRGICFDVTKFPKLKVGTSLVLRNAIRRTDEEGRLLILPSASKVLMSAPIQVPAHHQQDGGRLINPPPAELVEIKTALASPLKKRVSISGKSHSGRRTQRSNCKGGKTVMLRTISVQDNSTTSKVALWRIAPEAPIRPGDHVNITDVVINNYNNVISLSTTSKTTVKKMDSPLQTTVISVEAIGVTNGQAELYIDTGNMMTMSAKLLQQALEEDGQVMPDIEMATATGPIHLQVATKGLEVVSVIRLYALYILLT